MPKVIYVSAAGVEQAVDAVEGESVMAAAVKNGVPGIIGECGGNCMCATCHVYVEEPWTGALPPLSEDEDALLEGAASERRPESRLGCQLKMSAGLDGLTVRLPPCQV